MTDTPRPSTGLLPLLSQEQRELVLSGEAPCENMGDPDFPKRPSWVRAKLREMRLKRIGK